MNYSDDRVKQAGEVVQSFMAVSRVLAKLAGQNAAALGLTLIQMGILNTIAFTPGLTLKDVAERLSLPKSSMSVAVDHLVNAGLVERKDSKDDRREVNLTATAKGKELSVKSAAEAPSYRAMILALETTPPDDIRSLLRIHKHLLSTLDEGTSSGVCETEQGHTEPLGQRTW